MPSLLALDLATTVGFAVAPLDGVAAPLPVEAAAGRAPIPKPRSGSISFKPYADDPGRLYSAFASWLADLVRVTEPHALVFEAPLPRQSSSGAARRILGLVAITELLGERLRVPSVFEVHLAHVKKHATGSGNADKAAMLKACRARGWEVTSHDEADALLLADYAVAVLGRRAREAA